LVIANIFRSRLTNEIEKDNFRDFLDTIGKDIKRLLAVFFFISERLNDFEWRKIKNFRKDEVLRLMTGTKIPGSGYWFPAAKFFFAYQDGVNE